MYAMTCYILIRMNFLITLSLYSSYSTEKLDWFLDPYYMYIYNIFILSRYRSISSVNFYELYSNLFKACMPEHLVIFGRLRRRQHHVVCKYVHKVFYIIYIQCNIYVTALSKCS